MAISNIQTVTNSSIQLLPPAPVSMDQRDIRSSLITGGQYQHDETLTKWQDWATQFLNATNLIEDFPDPYMYDDWREWAERFVQTTL